MDAATIVTRLRSAGCLPALVEGKVRLYGDTGSLPPELREAIAAHRCAIVAHLRQPEQSIAYDLLANAAESGWFPRISGDTLEWYKGEEMNPNPMRSEVLQDALEQHRDAMVAVLRQPADPLVATPDGAAVTAAEPPEGGYHRIWICGACHLPRSGDDRPCPSCGAVGGHWTLRPANRFTGLT